MRLEYQARRELVYELLAGCPGVAGNAPEGTFYAFVRYDADVPAQDVVAAAMARGVGIRGGTEYGPSGQQPYPHRLFEQPRRLAGGRAPPPLAVRGD